MTPDERELSQQLFGGQERGSASIFPGLSLDKIAKDLGQEFKHQVGAGAHEIASLLFTGQSYVQYQREGQEDHQQQEQAQDSQHLERGGRSM